MGTYQKYVFMYLPCGPSMLDYPETSGNLQKPPETSGYLRKPPETGRGGFSTNEIF